MVTRMRNIPKTMATTKIVFICPSPGTSVIASTGLSHRASMVCSKPKILPNIKPKKVEKIPAVPIIAPSVTCFHLYSAKPPIASKSPCPTSPNITPKIKE